MLGPQPAITAAGATLALIGDASYSLYLTHTFILRALSRAWTLIGGDALPAVVYVGAALVVTISASLAIFRYLEDPMTKALQRRVRAWTKPAAMRQIEVAG
jgi:peptidoglycan/LPS O-acetylase OafA/YrhL